MAENAWQYFQPDLGVDSNTGLPNSGLGNPFFTDWDLGVYIQAVMDANATGLIGSDGAWGSSARLEKVVHFLETRELNNASYPYWFYQSSDGKRLSCKFRFSLLALLILLILGDYLLLSTMLESLIAV